MANEPLRVLVVDDDDDCREALVEILEVEGFEAAGARNGRDALDHLRGRRRPDLIVLDLMMPQMSGPEFRAEQLRDSELTQIPVIVLSAAHEGRRKAEAMRAAAYFPKPVRFETLFDVLRAHARRPGPELPRP